MKILDTIYREPYIQEKIGNQTFFLKMELYDETLDTLYYNIHMGVYSKRKHAVENELNARMTGLNPIQVVIFARKAFVALEEYLVDKCINSHNVHISCNWVDNRRRDAYYKFLSKRGYEYGRMDNRKIIYKLFKKKA